jgi:uncharacterized membrane protein YkoI
MFKRVIMALLIIIAISTVIITAFAFSDNNNPSNNNIFSNQLQLLNNPSAINSNVQVKDTPEKQKMLYYIQKTGENTKNLNHIQKLSIISPADAEKIATQYIEQPGASTGKPRLVDQDGKKVYIVPVIKNAKDVGEIDLDAHRGSNLGGAGGVKVKQVLNKVK